MNDLIKTLEGLEKKATKGPWKYAQWTSEDRDRIETITKSLPQIISALKDAERMKMALEIIADECDCDCDVEQGHFCIRHEALNAIAPTADTKESE